jgi:hypothetical protein
VPGIKNKQEAKILALDALRMLGFNLLAIVISSIVIYGAVFGYELFDLLTGGIEAYSLKILGVEQKAFYVVFYGMIDMVTERVRLVTTCVSYLLMLFLNIMYIRYRRKKFTYDNMETDWESQKMIHVRNNLIGYFALSLIPSIYFIAKGIKGVYQDLHVINVFSQEKGLGVPDWLTTFFNPQTTFYPITKSVTLGLLINLILFYAITTTMYLIKRKEKKIE